MGIGGLHSVGVLGADAVNGRNEKRLVVVASERGRLVVLDERTLAAAFASAAYLQRLGRFHHEGLIIAAGSVGGHDRWSDIDGTGVACILAVVFVNSGRNGTRPERWGCLFLISDGTTLCRMLGAEARRAHDHGRMPMILRPERTRHILGHIHTVAALVV